MIILALDTCLSACSAALVDGDLVRAWRFEPMVRGHQERLALMVQELMAEAGAAFSTVERIGVTVGPGSFTGLRVGLAFAKGLALALDIPCVGVGALQALGYGRAGLSVAIADARRDQAYWQAFRDGAPITPPQASGLADIVDWLTEQGGPDTLVGPGVGLLSARFPKATLLETPGPDPVAVAALAAAVEKPMPPAPLYLRTPDAKLPGGLEPTW